MSRRGILIGGICFSLGAISVGLAQTAMRPDQFIAAPWTWSGVQTFADGKLSIAGLTSGNSILKAPATGGGTITLPTGTGTLGFGSGTINSGTGGRLGWYSTTGTTIDGNANATISNGDLTLGQTSGPVQGSATLWGSTSGSLQIRPAAVAGTSSVLTLPGGTTNFSSTGGTNQVIKQASSGAALTVGTINCAFLSDGATGCSTPTGTSGGTLPLLNGTNTWSGSQTFGTVIGGINTQSGTTYTLVATDCGKTLIFTNSSAVTLTTLNSLVVGCSIAVEQKGTGQVTVANGSGATSGSSHSFTKTFGQKAIIGLFVDENIGGSAANFNITGDGA